LLVFEVAPESRIIHKSLLPLDPSYEISFII